MKRITGYGLWISDLKIYSEDCWENRVGIAGAH